MSRGTLVRNNLTGQIGEIVRGPKRAPHRRVWVQYRDWGASRPVLAHRDSVTKEKRHVEG